MWWSVSQEMTWSSCGNVHACGSGWAMSARPGLHEGPDGLRDRGTRDDMRRAVEHEALSLLRADEEQLVGVGDVVRERLPRQPVLRPGLRVRNPLDVDPRTCQNRARFAGSPVSVTQSGGACPYRRR